MLTTSIWQSQRLCELGGSIFCFINQEEQCLVDICKIKLSSGKERFIGYCSWYREVDENQLSLTLCRRAGKRWRTCYYDKRGNHLLWSNPLGEQIHNLAYDSTSKEHLPNGVYEAYEEALERMRTISAEIGDID